jgi:hypothetical protein
MRLHELHRIGRRKSMAGVRHPGELMFDPASPDQGSPFG